MQGIKNSTLQLTEISDVDFLRQFSWSLKSEIIL